MKLHYFMWSMLLALLPMRMVGQSLDRLPALAAQLDSLALQVPGLNEISELSLNQASLAHYIRALGYAHQVNVFIEETPSLVVTADWQNEPVKNILLFLCKEYQYSFDITGSIIAFHPYRPPAPIAPEPKALNLQWQNGQLSMDLRQDSLQKVIRMLSTLTGERILMRPGTQGFITAYLPPTPLDTALQALFTTNDFSIRKQPKGYYLVQPMYTLPQQDQTQPMGRTDFQLEALSNGNEPLLSISAQQADLSSLVQRIFEATDLPYMQYDQLAGIVSIETELMPLNKLLQALFQGTEYTYRKDEDFYLIGAKSLTALGTTEIVHLQYRPTYQAIDLIPGVEPPVRSGRESRSMPQNPEAMNYNSYGNMQNGSYGNGSLFPPQPQTQVVCLQHLRSFEQKQEAWKSSSIQN